MDIRAEIKGANELSPLARQRVYAALLGVDLYIKAPVSALQTVEDPASGVRAVPAFITHDEAVNFWSQAGSGEVLAIPFPALCAAARQAGGVVVDPTGANLCLDRSELLHLAHGEIPGAFTAWLSEMGRLGRPEAEVLDRLRRTHLHVITGKGGGDNQRLYLLEKSEDGTLAVPCFSSPVTLAQFADVRGLFGTEGEYAVGLIPGERCVQTASGMGAYILIDPDSPWETMLEPTLL